MFKLNAIKNVASNYNWRNLQLRILNDRDTCGPNWRYDKMISVLFRDNRTLIGKRQNLPAIEGSWATWVFVIWQLERKTDIQTGRGGEREPGAESKRSAESPRREQGHSRRNAGCLLAYGSALQVTLKTLRSRYKMKHTQNACNQCERGTTWTNSIPGIA